MLQFKDVKTTATASPVLFLLAILTFVFGGQSVQAEKDVQPNILFLFSDDQRPDTIGALGNPIIQTPNLDRLVKQGTSFTRATCAYPLCFPSRTEILTGCTGFRNKVFLSNRDANLSLPTLPAVLNKAGYQSYWVGKWHMAGRPMSRGFTESLGLFASGRRPKKPQFDSKGRIVTGYVGWMFQTDDRKLMPERGVGLTPNISQIFAESAIELLKRKSDKPFFLYVNFTAPHDPLLIPPKWDNVYDWRKMKVPENFLPRHPFDHGNFNGRDEKLLPWPRTKEDIKKELATYYAVISHMDEQIGKILDVLKETGQADHTIVVYASDHGLALGSHGLMGKQNMYEHTINVPLIFRGPEIPEGKISNAQCYLRDLFPTFCDFANTPKPKSLQSRSLLPILKNQTNEIYPFIVGYYRHAQRMIRTDRWKLIQYPEAKKTQLFDLINDPYELNNLSEKTECASIKQDLNHLLADWLREHQDPLQK